MKEVPSGEDPNYETLACDRPPVPGRGGLPLPPLPRPQGEDPLAPPLAPPAPWPAPQLRAGRSSRRPVRRLRPRRPQTLERARPRRPGRPAQGQQEPGQTVAGAAGAGVCRPATGAARWRLVEWAQTGPLRAPALRGRSLPRDRLALAEEVGLPAGGAQAAAPQGGHTRTA